MPQVEQNQPDIVENIRLWPMRGAPNEKHRHSRLQNVPQTQNIVTCTCKMCPKRKTLPGPLRHGALYLAFSRTTRPFRARPALYANTRSA